MADLFSKPFEYTQADLSAGADVLTDIGIHLKGSYGSFRDMNGKASFWLKFDKFVKGQAFRDLKALVLNNMVQDPSLLHERLAYALFRDGEVPAERVGYAWVRVNGEDFGLYVTVEVVDKRFLDAWYPANDGNLYDGQTGADFWSDQVQNFVQDEGKDTTKQDLSDLITELDKLDSPDTFLPGVQKLFDMPRYLDFAATEIWLGHWDGYAWTSNNYYVYHRPDNGLWSMTPWGTDKTFTEPLVPFGGKARLEKSCVASVPCRKALASAFKALLDRVDALDLSAKIDKIRAKTGEYADKDPRKPHTSEENIAAVEETRKFVIERKQSILDGLACENPEDIDKDGTSGCFGDCDDNDPDVHQGAKEVCDYVDNDCSGEADDGIACPPCVTLDAPSGARYVMCKTPKTWADADVDCLAQGGDLASIHNKDDN